MARGTINLSRFAGEDATKNLSRFAGLSRESDRRAAQRPVRVIGSARCKALLRGDPITLTLGAAHLDLSRSAGEV
jgi:hypothetical protein